MTALLLAILLAAGPQPRASSPPSALHPRPPIPTFTPTPTTTPTSTPVPLPPTAVPTPRLSVVARSRTINTSLLPAPRLVFQRLTHSRTPGVVSINGWLANTGGLAACSITMRIVVFDQIDSLVGSAEGSPRSPDLAPGHSSPFAFSVSIPKALEENPKFQIGTVSPSIGSYSNECRE